MEKSHSGPPEDDRAFLERALELGRAGWGRVHPNPMVGCVIVQDGEVVGEGWHEEYGAAHAEVNALGRAGGRARGATVYTSVEPCRHEGKTPPCTRALLEAGVARVVFGAPDPGRESGGGGKELQDAGVEVLGPLFTPGEARRENPLLFHDDPDRPWVALKLAVSVDGRIAARPGERTQLSGPLAGEEVQRLRAGFDGILIGSNTAVVDDPLLTVRGPVEPRVPPARIVLDTRGRVSPRARILTEGEAPTWIASAEDAPEEWRSAVTEAGGRVLPVPSRNDGRLDLSAVMARLRAEGIRALLCEGGGILASGLLQAGLVDRIHLVMAPRFLGAEGVPAFPGTPASSGAGASPRPGEPDGQWRADPVVRTFGSDLWITLDREA